MKYFCCPTDNMYSVLLRCGVEINSLLSLYTFIITLVETWHRDAKTPAFNILCTIVEKSANCNISITIFMPKENLYIAIESLTWIKIIFFAFNYMKK